MEQVEGCYGCRMLGRRVADAQATIAALEETILKMGEQAAVVAKDAMAAKEQVAALQARVKELEEWQQIVAGTQDRQDLIYRLSDHLTQRTAELEAIKADTKNMLDVATSRLREQVNDLQAELERVRGELVEAKDFLNTVTNDLNETAKERDDLRALIAALPKVEGEISERFCTGSYYSSPYDYRSHVTFETALVALLKHRQGMEG